MRGKRVFRGECDPAVRNIPAYAGKTDCTSIMMPGRKEHPRVCGENDAVFCRGFGFPGTSPRMRGKLAPLRAAAKRSRNIPAYAGKTRQWQSPHQPNPEHPRVCGENLGSDRCWSASEGTSPRMRGKHLPQLLFSGTCRNIPAYAGKTLALACGFE